MLTVALSIRNHAEQTKKTVFPIMPLYLIIEIIRNWMFVVTPFKSIPYPSNGTYKLPFAPRV